MEWIFQEGLVDMGFSGSSFTWMRGLIESTFKGAQLDRAVASILWRECFSNALVTHSDNVSLLLTLDDRDRRIASVF